MKTTDLFWLQQSAARDLPPLVVVGDELVIQQAEDTVGLLNGALKLFILLWRARRCRGTHTNKHTHM